MTLFFPGHHALVHAKVLSFDPVKQSGTVQLIGVYGRDPQGRPIVTPVKADPNYVRPGSFHEKSFEPKAVYAEGEWVAVIGIPAGPSGTEDPKNLMAGVQYQDFQTAYWIIGSLKHQPAPEHLDHEARIRLENEGKIPTFPPITYTPLPSEEEKG